MHMDGIDTKMISSGSTISLAPFSSRWKVKPSEKFQNIRQEIYRATLKPKSSFKISFYLTCSFRKALIVRISSRWFWTKTYCLMINSGAMSIIGTTGTDARILTAIVVAHFIYWTIRAYKAVSITTLSRIAEIIWFAHAFTDVSVNVIICIGTTRIRLTRIFRVKVSII